MIPDWLGDLLILFFCATLVLTALVKYPVKKEDDE